MNKLSVAAALLALAALPGAAQAQVSGNANVGRIPAFKAICPDNLEVTTKEGGPIMLNGKEAMLMVYSKDFSTATLDTITVTVEMDANDALSMNYSNTKTGLNVGCKIVPGDLFLNGKKIN